MNLNDYKYKKYKLDRYYIIKNNNLYTTSNSKFDNKLINCFCIKQLGSSVLPKIYLDVKINNSIVIKNHFIGEYKDLIDFILENQNRCIFIKGFSRASMAHLLRMINLKKDYKKLKKVVKK
ncbi:MAG: hypothetical protein IJD92_01325 [Bacilli bacterium]|nr:hypothetical protein [Bacilli bacterium]